MKFYNGALKKTAWTGHTAHACSLLSIVFLLPLSKSYVFVVNYVLILHIERNKK